MTLLEILVKELPGKGGWPAGVNRMWQDYDRELRSSGSNIGIFTERLADVHRERGIDHHQLTHGHFVYREKYESALAESKKVAWSGEGLPPVGVNCEAFFTTDDEPIWHSFVAKFIGKGYVVAMVGLEEICYSKEYLCSPAVNFRPIRSEEERKRGEAVDIMQEYFPSGGRDFDDVVNLYNAIAAGKIPHIKIV